MVVHGCPRKIGPFLPEGCVFFLLNYGCMIWPDELLMRIELKHVSKDTADLDDKIPEEWQYLGTRPDFGGSW